MSIRGENIYKRKDGRWEGRCKNGVHSNEKIRYISIYGKSHTADLHINSIIMKIKRNL